MVDKRRVPKRQRKTWIPSAEDIGASLVAAAVSALESHGGRPGIRGVPDRVETVDMTQSMFSRLERVDFPTLDEAISNHVSVDPAKGLPDTRGVALRLLVAALEFKECLAAYRKGGKDADLDSLLWALSHAEAVRGEMRVAFSFEFERNRLQWMREPGQAKGRQGRARAIARRNELIRAIAEGFKQARKTEGRKAPSTTQIARHVARRLEDSPETSQIRLSEKSLRDIISRRR